MKKLMIAMSAAAMVSLSASAADPVTLGGGIDFEKRSGGDTITTAENTFWQGTSGDSVVVSTNENKYLSIDTTDALYRMTGVYAAETPTAQTIPANGDITVSNRVMFTAADDAPEVSTVDKLVIWMRAAQDADGDTEALPAAVMVTSDGATNAIVEVTDPEAYTAAWHTLAIKAVAEGSGLTATSKFTVILDGTNYGSYASMVTGGVNAQTISSIGFKGTGAVDDIAFTKTAGVVVPEVAITVSGADVYADTECAILVTDGKTLTGTTNILAGTSFTWYIADADYLSVTSSVGTVGTKTQVEVGEGEEPYYLWPITYTTDAENTNVTMTITVSKPVDPTAEKSYDDAEAATSAASAINDSKSTMIAKPYEGMSDTLKTAYDRYVMAIADGTKVVFDFTEAGTNAVQTTVNTAAAATIADVSATKVSLDANDVVAGFYYQIVGGTVLGTFDKAGTPVQAQGKALTLPKPDLDDTTKGFYKVRVTVKNPTE